MKNTLNMAGLPSAIVVYSDSARGIYIPQHFAETASDQWDNVTDEDRAVLRAGPEHPQYWDAWSDVLDNATYTVTADGETYTWRLWQNGDLFATCDALMTDAEYEDFYGVTRSGEAPFCASTFVLRELA